MKNTRALALPLTAAALCLLAGPRPAWGAAPPDGAPPGFHHVRPGNMAHVVAFRFKPEATPEKIAEICRAFAELPDKVPGVVDFSWGTNISTEPHARGFTHLFAVTFADAAARDAYLPHPGHRAFVDLLRPALDAALVVDFPLESESTWYDGQVKHVVLFKYKPEATTEQVAAVREAFRRLPLKVPGTKDFQAGTNASPEGLSQGFDHAFILTFTDTAARDAYLPHPAHKALGEMLGPLLDGVFVIDFNVQSGSASE